MLIVIEGVDRTGKSSLARRLAEEVGAEVRHAGKPTHAYSLEEYETTIDSFDPRRDKLILDRFHLGEKVWPVVFGRETDFSDEVHRHVEMFLESRGYVRVQAVRDSDKLRSELVEYGEPLTPEDLPLAQQLFARALLFSGAPSHVWDYDECGDFHVKKIISHAKARREVVSRVWQAVGGGWMGSATPAALLVGDELGPEKEGRNPPFDVPFGPYLATSGHYLMRALGDLQWQHLAIVNSREERTFRERPLRQVWKAFGRPRVVALGRNASDLLESHGVRHEQVPHPQYWRRFHHHRLEEYTQMIKEAAGLGHGI